MKFEKIKRNLSLLVAFCMVVSLFQMPVMAEEASEPDAGPVSTVSVETGEPAEGLDLPEDALVDKEAGEPPEDLDLLDEALLDEAAMASLPDEGLVYDPDDEKSPPEPLEAVDEESGIQLLSLEEANDDEVIASGNCGEWPNEDSITWELTSSGVLTISGSGKICDYPGWRSWSADVKQVIFEDEITHIGNYAFEGCSSLALAELPTGVTHIGSGAFAGCASLTLTELPAGVNYIGGYAFDGCTSLALTELPTGVTSIDGSTFKGCTSLTLTELPAGVTYIGIAAFWGCTSLALTELPTGLKFIEERAFFDCPALALTKLPTGVAYIRTAAFYNCASLALTELPTGLTSIGDSAFSGCTSLALTELPAGVTYIGEMAFDGCTALTLTKLPAGITIIKGYAFRGCTSLALTELPAGVTYISYSAFEGCSSLVLTELPAGVTYIGGSAFCGCPALAFTELPMGVTYIGEYAFADCSALALTELPMGVTHIGYGAFRYCSSLALTELPAINSIGKMTFEGCISLALTELPAGVTSIGYYAFSGCTSMALTELPDSLKSIEFDAFRGCTSLALTELPAGVTSIGPRAFIGCTWPISTSHYTLGTDGNYTLAKTTVQRVKGSAKASALVEQFDHYHTASHENELLSQTMPEYIRYGEGITLRRYYDLDTVTVTINSGDGEPSIQEIPYGGTITEPTAPSKPGYDFGGWKDDNGQEYDFTTPVTGDLTLTLIPIWTAKGDTPYQVKHYLQNLAGDGYDLQYTDKLTAATDSVVEAIAKVYDGFHVAPTHPDRSTHPDRVASGIVTADGNLVMSIYYDRDIISVTLDAGDGSEPVTLKIPYGGTVTEPETPSRSGYDFGGWQDQNGNKFDFSTPVTGELTLTPIWTAKLTSSSSDSSSGSGRAPARSPKLEEELLDLEVPLAGIVFDDVLPGDAYYDDVMGAYNAGYMEGITSNLFCPDACLTRAQAADTFARVAAVKLAELEITGDFKDVNKTITYAEAITWANSAGVEIGYGNGYFGPTDYITREQLALMLYRTYSNEAEVLTWEGDFSDVNAVSDWAEAAVRWAVHMNLLEGTDAGELLPQGTVSRAEAAALILRVVNGGK